MKQRTNISFTDEQLRVLRRFREETGVGISELIRRLVDEYFKDKPQFLGSWLIRVPSDAIGMDDKSSAFTMEPFDLRRVK